MYVGAVGLMRDADTVDRRHVILLWWPVHEMRPPPEGDRRVATERQEMKPHIDVITLAVSDLERSLEFYRDGLGLKPGELVGTEYLGDDLTPGGAAAMFKLGGELMLMLYPRSELAKDANIAPGPAQSGEFSIGHVVTNRSDVDALLARAEDAGATLTDRAHDRPWGIYSGYFRDLDGHLWEIIWNPRLERREA
jgi:uncharacterized protein